MVPSCLTLCPLQKAKLERFKDFLRKKIPSKDIVEASEEDCSGASPITYHLYNTGLGPVIWAESFRYKCCLTVDDDGEISPDKFTQTT